MKPSFTRRLLHLTTASAAALSLWLGLPATASAEPTLHDEGIHVGLGAGLAPFGLVVSGNDVISPPPVPGLYVPVDIGPNLRLEPEFGIFRYSITLTSDGLEQSNALTLLRFGSGIFYRMALGESSGAYVGGRVGILLNTVSSDDYQPDAAGNQTKVTTTGSRTDISLGLAGGGEHFFTSYFSLGAEAQLGMLLLGDATTEREPPAESTGTEPETSGLVLETRSLLFARVYFF